ncbi:hypothetical protein C8Q78DRAFT_1078807 [Trametes maxima]|nr:hypothetical protein C8Q78DRAFT_1078807 [Trametes maxima]
MDRQERGPPQRHSSLPASLHRLMVSGPPQPPQSPSQDDPEDVSPVEEEEGGGIPLEGVSGPARPVSGAGQPLPSLILTQAAFEGVGAAAPIATRRQSRSPVLTTVGQEPAAAAAPTLQPPPFPPQRLPSDPVYYASASLPSTYTFPPPGPQLRPISWSPESAVRPPREGTRPGSPDRSTPPPARPRAQPSQTPVAPPSPPVAGPSRLREEAQAGGRKRKPRPREAHPGLPAQAGASTPGSAPTARLARDPGDSEHDFGRRARSPPSVFPARGGEEGPRAARGGSAPWRPEAGPSSRRAGEGGRGSPGTATVDNYPFAVGSTAYSVTTLSPLRATILRRGVDRVPPPEMSTPESAPAGVGAGPSSGGGRGGDGRGGGSGSDGEEAGRGRGKRRRRPGSSGAGAGEGSTTSSSSEQAQAPKSKKTLIACHFCRARKLRCDGQKPSCANCTKRGHPCTYEQAPKRRGPGRAPRGTRGGTPRRRTRPPARAASADPAPRTEAASAAAASGSGSGSGSARRRVRAPGASAPAPEAAGPSNAEPAPPPAASPSAFVSVFASASHSAPASASASASAPAPDAAHAYRYSPGSTQASARAPTRQSFEPQLRGPVPTYPGLAYSPPTASSSASSHGAGPLPPFHFYSLGGPRTMNRSVASDSVRSSNTSNVSSAPSVPDSEEGAEGSVADEFMDIAELEAFYQEPRPRPGPPDEGSQ